jgi:predicted  nucleic acid-binding Zn-ribbon protein
MEVFEIIRMGILNDEISYFVFLVLVSLFIIDVVFYTLIWFNVLFLDWQVKKGLIYRMPFRELIQGFEELLKISINEINTRAYVEDFFSRYKAVLLPFPLVSSIKTPVISTIKFIKNTVSLFILVGVLGTFVGIYTSLVSVLNTNNPGAILPGLESIAPVLSGMGTAFATSIVGMSLALMTTFLLKLFNVEQFLAGIMARLENYLDNEIKITSKPILVRQLHKIEQVLENGFTSMAQNTDDIYESIKGFKAFSSQFEEAAAYMEHFNTDLAGSMSDLKEFYETNKEFTEGFSEDVKAFGERFTRLFTSIDELTSQQAEIRRFMEKSTTIQAESISILKENIGILQGIYGEITESQQDLRETNSKMRQDFSQDIARLDELLKVIAKTAGEQQELAAGYQELVQTVVSLREELMAGFAASTGKFKHTMEEIKNSYHNEMNKNIKVFAEHVSLSNKIINKGFDSLVSKFENLDLLLGKYLSGLAFNASDLEGAIRELNQAVGAVETNIREHNRSIQKLSQLIREKLVLNQVFRPEGKKESPLQPEEGEDSAQPGEKFAKHPGK